MQKKTLKILFERIVYCQIKVSEEQTPRLPRNSLTVTVDYPELHSGLTTNAIDNRYRANVMNRAKGQAEKDSN